MAKLVFGMSQSLDGYVDGVTGELELPPPGPVLFRHFYEHRLVELAPGDPVAVLAAVRALVLGDAT
jgi:hypothetical protein